MGGLSFNMDKRYIDNVIWWTYSKFSNLAGNLDNDTGLKQVIGAMRAYMNSGFARRFTNNNNGRAELVENVSREEMADYMTRFLMDCSRNRPAQNEMQKSLYGEISISEMFDSPNEIAQKLKECFLGTKDDYNGINANDLVTTVVQLYAKDVIAEKQREQSTMAETAARKTKPEFGITNLQVNRDLVNYCRDEVLSGRQIKLQNDLVNAPNRTRPRREYNLGDEMMAVTDIGQARKNQEDSVLILYHPKNPKYKLMVVADGMGGRYGGELASQEIVKQMIPWFESLSTGYMAAVNENVLRMVWANKLQQINEDINRKYVNAGSTFVGAIVCDEKTVIASVGDSRGYILGKDNNLYQMTDDDNMAYMQWKTNWDRYENSLKGRMRRADIRKKDQQKDNLRFHRQSNIITGCLGAGEQDINVHFASIDNSKYRTLMLFSDGVTDCLSDNQILAITTKTDPKLLAKKIVDTALVTESDRPDLAGKMGFGTHISAGKDNATAVVYNGEER